MAHQDNWKVDGISVLDGGMDSGNAPSIIQQNQASFLVNATVRGGFAQNRPGFLKTPIPDRPTNFKQGRFQGAHEYRYPGGSAIVTSISGRFFRINVSTDFSVSDVSITGDLNPTLRDFAKFEQAEQWLIAQDGQSIPLIYDGASLRRSNLKIPEVQTGDTMAYVMGRLWISRGRQYIAGDLYGTPSPTTTPALGNADAVLKFTENTYIAEGGAFSVPMGGEGITGMIPIATPNTILGQGPLLIATPETIFANDVPIDRTLWKDLQYPVQTIQSVLNGAVSQESMVRVNSDVWFRDAEGGIRSFIQALRDFHAPGNTPQSHELLRISNLEDRRLLPWSSGALFDNRLLMTAWPQRNQDRGVWFQGLYVLNFDGVSGLGRKTPPCWESLWTGLRFLRLVPCTINKEKRLFAFVLDENDEIDLREISRDADFDEGDKRITWSIESKSYAHGDPKQFKKLESGELWVDNIFGQVDFDLKYRPDQYPCWFDWATAQRCAKYKWCPDDDPLKCKTIKEFKQQYRPQIEFGTPPEVCEDGVEKLAPNAYEYQYRLEITGPARVRMFLAYTSKADKVSEIECAADV